MSVAKVLIDGPAELVFEYVVPESLHRDVQPGARVRVPLGSRRATGTVTGLSSCSDAEARGIVLKPLAALIEGQPVIPPEAAGTGALDRGLLLRSARTGDAKRAPDVGAERENRVPQPEGRAPRPGAGGERTGGPRTDLSGSGGDRRAPCGVGRADPAGCALRCLRQVIGAKGDRGDRAGDHGERSARRGNISPERPARTQWSAGGVSQRRDRRPSTTRRRRGQCSFSG